MVEEFNKYPKIRQLGSDENKGIFIDGEDVIYVEEKMDGANFRFMVKDDNIIFGSRTQQLTSDKGEETNVNKNFMRCVRFVKDAYILYKKQFQEGLIYYGECMVKHSLEYDWEKIPPFLGFDIFDMKNNRFLLREDSIEIFNQIKLPTVPLIKKCRAKDIKLYNEETVPESAYASLSSQDRQAEGIVYKNYNKQIFAKFVREKFKEKNQEAFGSSKKYANNDDEILIAKYCTNARIDKTIFKLLDGGHKLEMSLMKHIPISVYMDIFEEEWKEICMKQWTISFHNVRRLISKRCVAVLKQMITNNALAE